MKGSRRALPFVLCALLLLPPFVAVTAAAAGASGDAGPATRAVITLHVPLSGEVHQALSRAGLELGESFAFIDGIEARGPRAVFERVKEFPFVAAVTYDAPIDLNLERARGVVNADTIARDFGEDGRNVTVAVVDSGIDAAHPGFAGRVKAEIKLVGGTTPQPSSGDEDGHGTHVAGIVAGNGAMSDKNRLRGLAPRAGLVGIDISDAFTTTTAIRAFQWIHEHRQEHNIRVVSNSWGREKETARYDPDDAVIRASNALVGDGIVMVFSAGNRGEHGANTLTVEAMNPNVIAVGATDFGGRVEEYSSKGPGLDVNGRPLTWTKPDLVAPGTGIVSARTSARAIGLTGEARYYVGMNGTSMAAPQVAAAAALLISRDPSLTPMLVHAILTGTARDLGPSGPDPETGNGLLDVDAALSALLANRDTQGKTTTIRIVHEKPLAARGQVSAAGGQILLASATPQLPPVPDVRVPVRVPDGGSHAKFFFNWTGPAGGFVVTLEDKAGQTLGPFGQVKAGSVLVDTPLRPGEWTLVAKPSGFLTHADYEVKGAVLVVETRLVNERATLNLPSPRPLWGAAGFFTDGAGLAPMVGALASGPAVAVAGLGVAGVGAGALGFAMRTRLRGQP